VVQCLSPLMAGKTSPSWATETTTITTDSNDPMVVLGSGSASPNALTISTGSNKLWTVKTNVVNKLYTYSDVLGVGGPSLIGPADGYSNPVNTVTGYANEIPFSWDRLSNAVEYKLYIAYDDAFKEMVTVVTVTDDKPTVVNPVGPDRSTTSDVNFMPGTTYYWRVKSSDPLYSPYSEARSFTVQPGVALVPIIGSPGNGAEITSLTPAFSWSPVSSATMYEFQMGTDTSFASPLTSAKLGATGIRPDVTLEVGMTYFWRVRATEPVMGSWSTISNFTVADAAATSAPQVTVEPSPAPIVNIPEIVIPAPIVNIPPQPEAPAPIASGYIWAIIIIGAVLVIAVIVLILRTRRTV